MKEQLLVLPGHPVMWAFYVNLLKPTGHVMHQQV